MRRFLIVVLLATIFLASCANGAGPGSLRQAEQEEVETETAAKSVDKSSQAVDDQPTLVPATLTLPAAEMANEETTQADADVLFVEAALRDDGTWTFAVTVEHEDTGWEDYADGWDVLLPDGTVIKPDPESPFTRLLLHPHENEQPFTRSQSGIMIPPDINSVTVRAHDIVDGFGGREVVVDLAAESGPDFEVIR